jgi:hypothetical protein
MGSLEGKGSSNPRLGHQKGSLASLTRKTSDSWLWAWLIHSPLMSLGPSSIPPKAPEGCILPGVGSPKKQVAPFACFVSSRFGFLTLNFSLFLSFVLWPGWSVQSPNRYQIRLQSRKEQSKRIGMFLL